MALVLAVSDLLGLPASLVISSAAGARLANVWDMAIQTWVEPESARRFLLESHPVLHGRRPVDVALESERGRAAVEGLLGRLQYGSAV